MVIPQPYQQLQRPTIPRRGFSRDWLSTLPVCARLTGEQRMAVSDFSWHNVEADTVEALALAYGYKRSSHTVARERLTEHVAERILRQSHKACP